MSLATVTRALVAACTLAAVAAPAFAESVTVKVAGLDAKAAHEQIVRAAREVCTQVLADEPLVHYVLADCINEAAAATEAKFAANERHLARLQTGH
jgi:hypothetical protein